MIAIFDVDFVFSCPCFVSDVQHATARSTENYEIGAYVNGKHVVKNFEIDYFKNEKSVFVCCFDHLVGGMRFDTKNCLHYTRRALFGMQLDNTCYKTKKCDQCYRKSIKRLLKYYQRFFYGKKNKD